MRATFWWLFCLASCGRTGFEGADADVLLVDARPSDSIATVWQFMGANEIVSPGASAVQLALGTATTGGELVVVAIARDPSGVVTSVTDNASSQGTYQPIANSTCSYTNASLELWYGQGSNPGATTVTAIANTNIWAMVTWRFVTPRPASVDAAVGATDPAPTDSPTAPPIMTAAPGEIVVAAMVTDASVTSLAGGGEFTNDSLANGNGFAHVTDPAAPAGVHVAIWNQTFMGGYCASAAAFAVGP